jgi:hypothetical protein
VTPAAPVGRPLSGHLGVVSAAAYGDERDPRYCPVTVALPPVEPGCQSKTSALIVKVDEEPPRLDLNILAA